QLFSGGQKLFLGVQQMVGGSLDPPHIGSRKVGRPRSLTRKVALKLRLDPDVVQAFRATGPGWQTKINATLRLSLRNAARAPAIKRRLKRRLKRGLTKPLDRAL